MTRENRRFWIVLGLILFFCCGLPCFHPVWVLLDGLQDWTAVTELTTSGARVQRDSMFPLLCVLIDGEVFCYGRVWAASAKDDQQLWAMRGLTRMKHLNLSYGQITNDGLNSLTTCTGLEELALGNTQVTDDGLKSLQPLRGLKELCLSNLPITDAGLIHLEPLKNLEHLALSGTKVTDEAIPHLKRLKSLRVLYLKNTAITPEGRQRLRAEIPCLYIHER